MLKKIQLEQFISGVSIAIGLSIGGYFIGQTMYNAKVALNTAEVKGLAERRVEADQANWKINFRVRGSSKSEIPGLYKKSEKIQTMIIELLKKNGFEDSEIETGVIDYKTKEFRDENQKLVDQKYQMKGSVIVESKKVKIVSKVRSSLNKLIAQGIDIENTSPIYRFTSLNKIKPQMLSEATKNARIAANEFAANAGVSVGGIRSARQGNFIIRDAGERYGDTEKIEKDVRVVTTITFYLTD